MKMIHLLDLHTNGPAVSAELRNHAAQLRQDAWTAKQLKVACSITPRCR